MAESAEPTCSSEQRIASESADGVASARRSSPTPSRKATDGTDSMSGESEEKADAVVSHEPGMQESELEV